MSPTNHDLAQRLIEGDPAVMNDIVADCVPAVRRRLECKYHGRFQLSDIDDVMQQALFRLWIHRERFARDKGTLGGWLAGIAINVARELSQASWMKARGLEVSSDLALLACAAPPNVASDAMQSGRLCSVQMQVLRECLETLTTRQRLVIFAAFEAQHHGGSSRTMAAELGVAPSTVRNHLRRAWAKLHRELGRRGARCGLRDQARSSATPYTVLVCS